MFIVGRSPHNSKYPSKSGSKTGELVENVYSQEPTASHSKASNEYEVLPEKTTVPGGAAETSCPLVPEKNVSERSLPQQLVTVSKSPTSLADKSHDDSDENGLSGIGKTSVQVYGRSMYANLEKSDIEVHKKASDLTAKQPNQLKTSTPIKSNSKSSFKPGYVNLTLEAVLKK